MTTRLMRLKNLKFFFSRSKLRKSRLAMIANLNVGILLSGTLLCIKFSFKSFIRFGEEHFLFLQCSNSFVCLQIELFQSGFKSRFFGLYVFFAFFRKYIFDKSTMAISCSKIFRTQVFVGFAVFSFCV